MARRPFGRRSRHSDPARGDSGSRDEELARALYEQHAAVLLTYTLQLTSGDRQWAEDVVQETLVRAWHSADRLEPGRGPVRPWLFTMARRIVVDGQRRRTARPLEADPGPLEFNQAMDEIDQSLSALAIGDALASLMPNHREVIVETYFRGRTVEEVARTLCLPVSTVRSRCYYAMRALRLALEERGLTR